MTYNVSSGTLKLYNSLCGFSALGCPNVTPPPRAWLHRTGENIVIKCNDTLETWFLTCQGNRWIGDVTNCTFPDSK